MSDDPLDRARNAYDRMAWAEAYAGFCALDEDAPLGSIDLERAARAAELVGRTSESDALWQRAVHESARIGRDARRVVKHLTSRVRTPGVASPRDAANSGGVRSDA
jgi:hypothetical protein